MNIDIRKNELQLGCFMESDLLSCSFNRDKSECSGLTAQSQELGPQQCCVKGCLQEVLVAQKTVEGMFNANKGTSQASPY